MKREKIFEAQEEGRWVREEKKNKVNEKRQNQKE
jgi:hypothetical protein